MQLRRPFGSPFKLAGDPYTTDYHPGWFFGVDVRFFYEGCVLGLELVSAYSRRHQEKASLLYAEPAPSFPAEFFAMFD